MGRKDSTAWNPLPGPNPDSVSSPRRLRPGQRLNNPLPAWLVGVTLHCEHEEARPKAGHDRRSCRRYLRGDGRQGGVPETMFGDVPEDFYSLVGRVTMVAALLENRLHVLFCVLANAPQDRLAGEPGKRLIRECRQRLDRVRPERHDEAAALLDAAEAALSRRHEVVYSLWPFAPGDRVHRWRDVPTRRRESDEVVQWTSFHAGRLPDLVADLVDLFERCGRLEQ